MKRTVIIIAMMLMATSLLAQNPKPEQDKDKPVGQDPNSTFKVDVKLVNVFATVTDQNGAPVTDLRKEDFRISEDGVPQSVAVFEQQSEVPLSIIIAIDASQSVGKDLRIELEAAQKFVANILRPQDSVSLYQFSETVRQVVPFTSSIERINRGIQNVRLGAATALYDAIYLGGQALVNRKGRKVMVVITDGGDTVSSVSYQEALRAAQQSEALLYSIIDVPIAASAGRNTGGEHALIQLSQDTGGKHYYAETATKLDQVFQQISRELRTQYVMGYYPNRRLAESDFRRIEVKVTRYVPPTTATTAKGNSGDGEDRRNPTPTSYKVRHRSGYYTSKLE